MSRAGSRATFLALSLLAAAACSNTPATPDAQYAIDISGSLVTESASVTLNEAAVFLDGTEVGRAVCETSCTSLSLSAAASGNRGVHTVDFQLIRQQCALLPCANKQDYQSGGTVVVLGTGGQGKQLQLPDQAASLNQGDKVSYRIYVNP